MHAIKPLCQGILAELCPTTTETQLQQAHHNGWQIDCPDVYCHRCGSSAGPTSATRSGCAFCVNTPIAWDRIIRLSAYTDPVSRWVVSMKFHRDWSWAPWFGRSLADLVQHPNDTQNTAVCPVPMHWTRRFFRGYNQAHLIAASFAQHRHWPLAPLLRRTRYTSPQTTLPPSRRVSNIRKSVAMKPVDLTGWHIWLVDDVKTTGSTLAACAKLLHRAGASSVNVAVVAVADPRGNNFKTT
jgi:ComF family protein